MRAALRQARECVTGGAGTTEQGAGLRALFRPPSSIMLPLGAATGRGALPPCAQHAAATHSSEWTEMCKVPWVTSAPRTREQLEERCSVCQEPLVDGSCPNAVCRLPDRDFSHIFTVSDDAEEMWQLIYRYKYGEEKHLAEDLGRCSSSSSRTIVPSYRGSTCSLPSRSTSGHRPRACGTTCI